MFKKKGNTSAGAFLLFTLIFELLFWVIAVLVIYANGYFQKSKITEHIIFQNVHFAWLLVVLPLFIWLIYRIIQSKQLFLAKIPSALHSYFFQVSNSKNWMIYYIFMRNAFVFLVFALMQPVFGKKTTTLSSAGAEVAFVVDISASMNTKDLSGNVSRIDAAKRAMNQIVNTSNAARYGIIAFAGNAFPHLPMTADKGAAKMYIEQLNTNLMSNQGTDIGLALSLAHQFFTKDDLRKIVVLITDGEDHEGGIDEALAQLATQNIELLLLGLGSKNGGVVPKDPNYPEKGYLRDTEGNPVISKMSYELIRDLAKRSNGEFEVSEDGFPTVSYLLTLINNSSTTNSVDLKLEIIQDRFHEMLLISLAFLVGLITWQIFQLRKNVEIK